MKYVVALSLALLITACSAVTPTPVISLFRTDSTSVLKGQCTVLRWDVSGNVDVRIDTNIGLSIGNVPSSGSVTVCPIITTAYTLNARNRVGSASAQQTLLIEVK